MENENELDRSAIDMDAPAILTNAEEEDPMLPQAGGESEEGGEEVKIRGKASVSPSEDTATETGRIPYSRFEKVNEAKIRAEERLSMLEEQLAKSSQKSDSGQEVEMPKEWEDILGDTAEGKAAYSLLMKMNEKSRSEETERIFEELEKRQQMKQEVEIENIQYIDDNLAVLEEKLGRDLTEAEESSILDIQDEFTPQGEDGKYIAPLLSSEKAFEIHNLRQTASRGEKSQARRKVVSLTGASSEGEGSSSDYSNYNPLAWGEWEKRL